MPQIVSHNLNIHQHGIRFYSGLHFARRLAGRRSKVSAAASGQRSFRKARRALVPGACRTNPKGPKALRPHTLRVLGPKIAFCKVFGTFCEP